jgi:hypothetical protein
MRIVSPFGAALHLWPDGGDVLHFFGNVLGKVGSVSSFTAVQLDAPVSLPLSNYYFAENDMVGATNGIMGSPPAGFPLSPAVRGNRGAAGFVVTGSAPSTTAIVNSGPADCLYSVTWTSLSSASVQYRGTSTQTLSTSTPPLQVFLPVGATLSLDGAGFSWTGFCQP